MKVCIIGAGFSGLSVAYHLVKHNQEESAVHNHKNRPLFDVEILEARDRIGGRVFPLDMSQDPTDPVIVDMGGQWIHESNAKRNPIVQLLQELAIPLRYARQKELDAKAEEEGNHETNPSLLRPKVSSGTYLPDGTRIPDPTFQKAQKFYYKALNKYNPRTIDRDTSWQDLLDDACQTTPKPTTTSPLVPQILRYLGHRSEVFEGGRLRELSVSLDELYQNLGGPDDIAEGGYHAVLEKVANVIGRERIHLHCPVQDIYYEPLSNNNNNKGDNKDENENNNNSPGVRIQFCRNGNAETLVADGCVCTVPLGVLQKRAIHFHPSLPLAHVQSIDAMGMGVLDKVMMLFEEQFWETDLQVGIAHDDPTRIQTFCDCSQDYNGKPVLAMFLGGDAARRFDRETDGLSNDQVLAEAMATLRILFGEDTNLPEPVSFQVSRWLQDPYAFGSYSFAKIGSTEQDYDQVAQPGGKNLFFAGEHTSKRHHSTVHGAWETGKREAERLIQVASSSSSSKSRPSLSKKAALRS